MSRPYTLPVLENHPQMGRTYCPMCGSEQEGGEVKHAPDPDDELAMRAIRKLCRLFNSNTKAMRVLAMTVTNPELSMSQISNTLGVSKSRGAELAADVVRLFPEAAALMGSLAPAARGQRDRWERAKQQREAGHES